MVLRGQRAIMVHMGRSWRKIMDLKRRRRFPMNKIEGRWESTTEAIEQWRNQILIQQKEELEAGSSPV